MLKKILLSAFALGVVSSTVFASDDISCPSINKVVQTADRLDTADKVGSSIYQVYYSHVAFRESNLPWYVYVNDVEAISSADALKAGRKLVAQVSTRKDDKAVKDEEHHYNCYYGNGNIQVSSGYVNRR